MEAILKVEAKPREDGVVVSQEDYQLLQRAKMARKSMSSFLAHYGLKAKRTEMPYKYTVHAVQFYADMLDGIDRNAERDAILYE